MGASGCTAGGDAKFSLTPLCFIRWWGESSDRWDVKTTSQPLWRSAYDLVALRTLLYARREIPDLLPNHGGWSPITIHFDGSIVPRTVKGNVSFKGKVFAAYPGDLVFSKIDARNGAIGLMPNDIPCGVVTSEYPVYQIDTQTIEPEYLALLLRTIEFRRLVNNLVSGTSGRKRVQPDQFVQLEIPLPDRAIQQTLVSDYKQTIIEANALEMRASEIETEAKREFEIQLGITLAELGIRPSAFIIWFSQAERWTVESNQLIHMGHQTSPLSSYPIVLLKDIAEVVYGLQISPARRPSLNAVPYLRVANVQRGRLDLSVVKQMEVSRQEAEKYALQFGDILLCEGNSAELVGRGAIWQGEIEVCLHQNHVLRVRLNQELALPEFILHYINSSAGQSYFRSKAKRTTNLASINSREVANMPVPLPPLDIQQALLSKFRNTQAEVGQLRTRASALRELAPRNFENALIQDIKSE